MDPFNPISSTPPTPPDDSASSEDNKAQERREDPAHAVRPAPCEGETPAGAEGPVAPPHPGRLARPVLLPTPQNFQAAVARATSRPAPPPELLQQLVEFAAVHRNSDGLMEFRLGLVREALGGLQIQLQAYGNRRIGLKI